MNDNDYYIIPLDGFIRNSFERFFYTITNIFNNNNNLKDYLIIMNIFINKKENIIKINYFVIYILII